MPFRFGALRRLCQTAIVDGAVPGLVVLVASGGRTVFHEAFGHRQIVPRRLRADTATVYDVASLTKAVATSVVAMQLVSAGRLALGDPVVRRLPEFRGPDKEKVTVRHLLCHASGLPAWRPFYEKADGAASPRWSVELLASHEPLEYAPGARSLYSDVGFINLGWLLERTAGVRLDVLADRGIFQPLALESTTFVNLADTEARARLLANRHVAATERCPVRKRVMLGEVHDLNAFAMGGIAGHAGLFSTAGDLGSIAAALVACWKGGSRAGAPEGRGELVARDVVREFWTAAGIPGSTWRLGWDGPAAAGSAAGARLSRDAVGHLGFTGCSLWIDPERETWIVMLTNRVHPVVREEPRIRALRPAVNDAALEAVRYRA
jgi:CubicO group peptidase (beta-lactamase class C family)